jgi:hypothetical protein
VTPYLKKQPKHKKAGGLAQVVEHLVSKHKAVSSNPSITKKEKRKKG